MFMGTDSRGASMGQPSARSSFPPPAHAPPQDRNAHPSMQGQPPRSQYQQQRPSIPYPQQYNRGPPPQRFDARQPLPPSQHHQQAIRAPHFVDSQQQPLPLRGAPDQFNMREMAFRPDMMRNSNNSVEPLPFHHSDPQIAQAAFHAETAMRAEAAIREKMRAEMQARESMSPLNHRETMTQLSSSQQISLAASIPLRESLVQNVRNPITSENMRAMEVARAKMALAAQTAASNADSGGRQKSPTKQANIQDAASALLNMGSIIKQSEDSSDEKTESVDGDEPIKTINGKPFPTRLALPEDEEKLNSMHCFLRAELLELFLIEQAPAPPPKPAPGEENTLEALEAELVHQPPPNSVANRIGIRCVHCSRKKKIYGQECEAPMAVFYPKSLAELYRLVTSWQRVHLRKCKSLPKGMRETYQTLRANDKTRGKTHYWVTSAKRIGLKDSNRPAGGIIWDP